MLIFLRKKLFSVTRRNMLIWPLVLGRSLLYNSLFSSGEQFLYFLAANISLKLFRLGRRQAGYRRRARAVDRFLVVCVSCSPTARFNHSFASQATI